MNYLSLCAIAKNEQNYLLEWVAFHKIVGVERIILYDNESTIPIRQTLQPYIREGFVDVLDAPGRGIQMDVYARCLREFGHETRWLGFIDIDEYLIPKQTDDIKEILSDYEDYASFQVSWRLFGSNGHQTKSNQLTIERFTAASPTWWVENRHCKPICQPAKIRPIPASNPHYVIPKIGERCVSEDFFPAPNAFALHFCAEKLQLNHYVIRSLEEFTEKIKKGRIDTTKHPGKSLNDFHYFDKMATEKDECALRFLPALKAELERIG